MEIDEKIDSLNLIPSPLLEKERVNRGYFSQPVHSPKYDAF